METTSGPLLQASDDAALFGAAAADTPHSNIEPTRSTSQTSTSLTLDAAYQSAMLTHPRIQAQQRELDAAQTEQSAGRWLRFPSVTLQASGGLLSSGGTEAQSGAAVTVTQPLWDAGRTDAQLATLAQRRDTAAMQLEEVRTEVMLSLAQAFMDQDRLRRRADSAAINAAAHRRLLDLIQRRADQKVSSLADLNLARTRWLQADGEAKASHAAWRRARAALEPLIGQPVTGLALAPVEARQGQPLAAVSIEQAIDEALSQSSTLRRLELQVNLARSDARLREGAIYPQIGLRYEHQTAATGATPRHALRLALDYQPGAGLTSWAAAEAARQRIAVADEGLRQAQTELRQQVTDLSLEIESLRAQQETARDVESASQQIVASFLRQFTAGRKSWIEVLNAQREAAQVNAQVIDLELGMRLAQERLAILTGRLATPVSRPPTPNSPP